MGAEFIWQKKNKQRTIFNRFKLLGIRRLFESKAKKILKRMQSFGQMLKIQHLPGG